MMEESSKPLRESERKIKLAIQDKIQDLVKSAKLRKCKTGSALKEMNYENYF